MWGLWKEKPHTSKDSMKSMMNLFKMRDKSTLFQKLKKYIHNIGWLFVGKIFRMGFSMIVGIWVARYLGVEKFGILSYAIAFVLLFRPVAMFQLEGICVREIIKSPDEKNDILGSAFVLSLTAGLISFLIVINLISVFQPGKPIYLAIVSIVGFGLIFLSLEVFDYWFQARVNSKPVVMARTVALVITSLLKIIGILLKAPLLFFAWINLVELILVGVALVIAYITSGSLMRELRARVKWIKKLLHDAWPLALSGIAATIYLRIDKIMLGQMLGANEVGIYSAATRLAEAWYFLPISIMASLYPAIIQSIKNTSIDPNKRMQQIYNMMTLMGYIVAIVTTLFAAPIVTLLFGDEYYQSARVLKMYIWAGIFVNIAMAKSAYLKAMNYTKIQFISTAFGAITNIALNLVFIKNYGVIGATWATIISYSIEAYFILFFFPKTRQQAKMITKAIFVPIVRLKGLT
jgi:O-antigen/teichoic acid export membrane protein